jgi:hypothetical protein
MRIPVAAGAKYLRLQARQLGVLSQLRSKCQRVNSRKNRSVAGRTGRVEMWNLVTKAGSGSPSPRGTLWPRLSDFCDLLLPTRDFIGLTGHFVESDDPIECLPKHVLAFPGDLVISFFYPLVT